MASDPSGTVDKGNVYEKVVGTPLGSGGALPPPRISAAVVLWRRVEGGGPDDVEVYWVKRAEALAFMGGWHAFPGGGLAKPDAALPVSGAPQLGSDAPPGGGTAGIPAGPRRAEPGPPAGARRLRPARAVRGDGHPPLHAHRRSRGYGGAPAGPAGWRAQILRRSPDPGGEARRLPPGLRRPLGHAPVRAHPVRQPLLPSGMAAGRLLRARRPPGRSSNTAPGSTPPRRGRPGTAATCWPRRRSSTSWRC